MHEVLLIHHDNTPVVEQFQNNIKFNPSTEDLNKSDIDTFISHNIIPQLEEKSFHILCIKDTLSDNYIDFYGLILAHHIRLSHDVLHDKSFVPIIILSDINALMINKLTNFGRLLFTKNIFLCANNFNEVEQLLSMNLQPMNVDEYENSFLNAIHIEPPRDYLSHHSITNEWAIDQWSQMLNITSNTIMENRNKISSLLYYKYLISKYHLEKKYSLKIKQKQADGSLLLVDDKWHEGWENILDGFTSAHFSDARFSTLRAINKHTNMETLKSIIVEQLNSDVPDVILLDLRLLDSENNAIKLHDEKFNRQKINHISGIVILNLIKALNPSIQVIMFTASSDSLILDEIRDKGVLGYVKKDAPTDQYQASKTNFNKLEKLIRLGFNRKYLKKIYFTQTEILNLAYLDRYPEITSNVQQVFTVLNSNLPQPFLYAMFTIFKCFELIVDLFIREEKKGKDRIAIWKHNDTPVSITFNTTENKIKAILCEKFHINDETVENEIRKIVCCRNNAIHPGNGSSYCQQDLITEPDQIHIIQWFDILHMILVKMGSIVENKHFE